MPNDRLDDSGIIKEQTRRNILKTIGATGLASGSLSGIAAAEDEDSEEDTSYKHKDPKEVFDEEVLEKSDEELDRMMEDLWYEGKGKEGFTTQVDENCFADALDINKLPLIEFDLCLLDRPCGVSLTVGALGQSETAEFQSCSEYCRTFNLNGGAEIVEIKACYDHSDHVLTLEVERCNWRPSRGWDCPTDSTYTYDTGL